MKFGLEDHIIEKIKRVLEEQPKVDKAYIFGSRAKGIYRSDSDIDIAVRGYEMTIEDILKTSAALDKSGIGFEVDLVDYDSIKEEALREHIDRIGIEAYTRWEKTKLANAPLEIIDGDRGSNYPNQKDLLVSGDCLFLSTKNVCEEGFEFTENQFITKEKDKLLRKGKLERNDVVLTTRGTVGNIAYYSQIVPFDSIRINSGMVIIRPDTNRLNPDFNYYLFQNLKSSFSTYTSGSAQPQLPIRDLKLIEVEIPPIMDQIAISSILKSLDNKIVLLLIQNETLESTVETLFRQWFMADQKDSKLIKISEIVEINPESISRNYPYANIEYLDTGSITKGVIGGFQEYLLTEAPSRAQRIVKKNDIVYSLVRPIQRHYGILDKIKPNTIVSTGFCVLRCKEVWVHYIYLLLTLNENVEYLDMLADGSTSAYPSLRPADIADFEFSSPDKEKLKQFSGFSTDVWEKININRTEITKLITFRDTLLPKLLSGEARVKLP